MNIRTIFGFLPPRLLYSQAELPVMDVSLPKLAVLLIKKTPEVTHIPNLTPGETIKTGQKIYDKNQKLLVYSSVTGTVNEIYNLSGINEDFTAIAINTTEDDAWDAECQPIEDYRNREPAALISILHDAGFPIDINDAKKPDAIILNCLESDLLVSIVRNALVDSGESIKKGLRLLKKISGCDTVIIAVPGELRDHAEGIAVDHGEIIAVVDMVKPVYPSGMKEIVARALSRKGIRRPLVVTPEYCNSITTFLEKGCPAIHKFITLIDGNNVRTNMRVRIGTPISHILREGNVKISDHDKLILGGTMRGVSAFHAEFPITADIDAVMVQDKDAVVTPGNDACLNCGKCVSVCPNRLQAHLLARYSEFSLFDKCKDFDIDDCIECGMCAYVCMSRRALVHYITFAKKELAKKEREEHAVQ
jgi:electron transport complex protein RnfC